MSDKSIAEIIGWREDGGDTQYLPFYVKSDGTYGYGEPDCDDMLAWLRECVKDGDWNTEGGLTFYVSDEGVWIDWYDATGGDGVKHPEPNLHAALEAAVRAVHDDEEAK